MKKHPTLLTATIFLALSFSAPAIAEALIVAGSTTVQKRILEPGALKFKEVSGIDLKVQGIGTGHGMLALFKGKVAAAAASESLEDAISSANIAAANANVNTVVVVPQGLQYHELAVDNIVVIVNRDNPISALNKEQLKAIYTGKMTNWKQLGGNDQAIKVVISSPGAATRNIFQKQMLDGAPYVAGAMEMASTRNEINEVSRDAGAIGALSEGFFRLNPRHTRTVTTPPLSRPLGLITVGEPSAKVRQLVEFIVSGEGNALIR